MIPHGSATRIWWLCVSDSVALKRRNNHSENDFLSISAEDIISHIKRDYQIDVLVSDKKLMEKKYNNLIIDNISLDEIMLLMVKGERNERFDSKSLL